MSEDIYRLIANEMTAVETLMRQVLSGTDPFVDEVVRYAVQIGGKRLRPAVVLLTGKTIGTTTDHHLKAAAALEFVHTATLIHDDILDGATLRRHLATFNVKWNAQVGVLAGDWLLTKALDLMTQTGDIEGLKALTAACRQTCEGELRQIGAAGKFEMSSEEYLQIIACKTAPFLACAAELGACYASASPAVRERFRWFGQQLGLAFQMIDDVLDLIGEAHTAGKTLRTDLIHRKPTLPLILYLQKTTEKEQREVLERLRRDDFDEQSANWVVERLNQAGAVEEAKKTAVQLIEQATEALSEVKGNEAAKQALVQLARYVIDREK